MIQCYALWDSSIKRRLRISKMQNSKPERGILICNRLYGNETDESAERVPVHLSHITRSADSMYVKQFTQFGALSRKERLCLAYYLLHLLILERQSMARDSFSFRYFSLSLKQLILMSSWISKRLHIGYNRASVQTLPATRTPRGVGQLARELCRRWTILLKFNCNI